ncbi:Ger(x)C family spore germination protein [Clostridium sp. UBA1056]|uniref:Ger(x)C family spore germination protein n=1 Tax=unclassified Clostridium TaxID=2614128 RepID=UPI0032162D0D
MKNKIIKLIPVMMISLLLTGCWDSVEIDRKAFVSTIGIDIGDDIDVRSKMINSKESTSEKSIENNNTLKVTYGFPDVRNMNAKKGTASELAITVDGYSMTDAYFKAIGKSSRTLHFGHSKLLLLSDELFQYPEILKEIMDYIEREPSLNRSVTMIIVKGKAKDYAKVKPEMEENIHNYITSLMGNSSKNGTVAPITLTKYIDMLKSYDISMLPVFSLENEKDIELKGMAVIKDFTIKDYLNNNQITDIQILRGDIGACRKAINRDGHNIDYYLKNVDKSLHIGYENNKLQLEYVINTEGTLKGYYTEAERLDSGIIEEIEKQFDESMKKDFEEIINFTSNSLKLDVIDIGSDIRRFHRGIWSEVENNWPEALRTAEISIKVNNDIRNIGLSN